MICALVMIFCNNVSAQKKPFSLGGKKAGIGIGNFDTYSGIRFNFKDKKVNTINGLNLAANSGANVATNGISLALFFNADEDINGISFGTAANFGDNRNGLTTSTFAVFCFNNNGISISSCFTFVEKMNGICVSGFLIMGPFGGDDPFISKNTINGIAIAGYAVMANRINGITIAGYNKIENQYGLSIGLVNKAQKLRGIQMGLINYAGNNPKGLKWLPFLNMHLGK